MSGVYIHLSEIQNKCSFNIVLFIQHGSKPAMAHSSWQVFSSTRASRTNDPDEVLVMLDEIPTDNESTTEEEVDSDKDADQLCR